MFDIDKIKFDEKGLVPCIVQDYVTGRVLTLAYMSRESLEITLEKKLTCFYSRSRQELWLKGETSGNYQRVVTLEADCDGDAVLARVVRDGAACHRGNDSCFDDTMNIKFEENAMEMIDIYDENKKKTGEVRQRGRGLGKGEYMLYVLAILEDEYGKILATRRSLDKKWAAGVWEIPGGSVKSGENSETAVLREIIEETGLDIAKHKGRLIYSYKNEDTESGDNYFVDIYYFKGCFNKSIIKVNPDEVIDYKFVDEADINKLSKEEGFLHYERLREAMAGI